MSRSNDKRFYAATLGMSSHQISYPQVDAAIARRETFLQASISQQDIIYESIQRSRRFSVSYIRLFIIPLAPSRAVMSVRHTSSHSPTAAVVAASSIAL